MATKNPLRIPTVLKLIEILKGCQRHFKEDSRFPGWFSNSMFLWFRGHADMNWELKASVYRNNNYTHGKEIVSNRIYCSHALSLDSLFPRIERGNTEKADALFLMRHSGMSTRMLDWTSSPLAATFFAVSSMPEKDGALWMLLPNLFNYTQSQKNDIFEAEEPPALEIIRRAFSHENEEPTVKHAAVYPRHLSLRQKAQRAVYTVHDSEECLDDLFTEETECCLTKFVIPKEHKKNIQDDLDILGCNSASLFPDLEGLARYYHGSAH